jgi:hypothetical protein
MYAFLKIQLHQMYYLSRLVHKPVVVVLEQVLRLEQQVRRLDQRRYMLDLVLDILPELLVRQEEPVARLLVATAYLFQLFGMLLRTAAALVVLAQNVTRSAEEIYLPEQPQILLF